MTDFIHIDPFDYQAQSFKGLSYIGQKIRDKTFLSCIFSDCSFRESRFEDCRFYDCRFKNCDLSLAEVKRCVFAEIEFADSKLVGINWTEADWPKQGLLRSINFVNCVLNYVTFIGLTLRGIKLTGCIAHAVDFAEVDLSGADCSHTDFAESRFLQTNLTGADFTGARNYAIAPTLNTLKQAKFSFPEAMALLYGLDIVLVE